MEGGGGRVCVCIGKDRNEVSFLARAGRAKEWNRKAVLKMGCVLQQWFGVFVVSAFDTFCAVEGPTYRRDLNIDTISWF